MAGESARAYARRQREKAERHIRVAEAYERGAAGEEETATRLDKLRPQGWVMLHDVRWPGRPRANIDHVAIGPGGIFVIDSKNWSGPIVVRDNVLLQRGKRRERAVAGAAEAALAITGVLGQVPATGVLCFVRDEELTSTARDVLLCSTATITRMRSSQPPTLHPDAVQRFAHLLRTSLDGPPPPRRKAVPSPSAQAVLGPRSTHRWVSSLSEKLIRVAFLGIAFLVVGGLAISFATSIGKNAVANVLGGTADIGETVSIPGTDVRPALGVTALRVVGTRASARLGRPRTGDHLMAAELRIQNRGDRGWNYSSSTSVSAVGSDGVRYQASAPAPVKAGGVLSATSVARPHRFVQGWVVFELPRGVSITEVRVWVGPGVSRRVIWRPTS